MLLSFIIFKSLMQQIIGLSTGKYDICFKTFTLCGVKLYKQFVELNDACDDICSVDLVDDFVVSTVTYESICLHVES